MYVKYHFQGCVDNYENCPAWTRLGFCDTNAKFMLFNCRESCGTCGFRSRKIFIISKLNTEFANTQIKLLVYLTRRIILAKQEEQTETIFHI